LSASTASSTSHSTQEIIQASLLNSLETKQQSGTSHQRAGYGIAVTQNAPRLGRSGKEKISRVNIAAKLHQCLLEKAATLRNIARTTAKHPAIESVRILNYNEDVWCLTVPDEESFSLSNGAIVHNCSHAADAFRYLAVAWTEAKPAAEDEPIRFKAQGNFNDMLDLVKKRRTHV